MKLVKNILIINDAKKLLKKSNDKYHDTNHTKAVVANAKLLQKFYPGTSKEIIIISAWWHDVGRLYQQQGHEKISAELVIKELQKFNYKKDFIESVFKAIESHNWNANPQTIEGKIIRDADKLDFININRWKRAIRAHQYQHVEDTNDLLIGLRDKLLTLPESKKIYDKRFPSFSKFYNQIKGN